MCEISINASSQEEDYEINISGTCAEFANAKKQLNGLTGGVFALKHRLETYCPLSIRHVVIEPVGHSNSVVTAVIEEEAFKLSGDAHAFRKLSEFLASLSNLSAGEHFHLDWFANADMLAPTTANMSFIFFIEAEAD
jgi:hypothetical protein